MSFENGMFAHETSDTSLQIKAYQWAVSLSSSDGDSAEDETHHELLV